LVTNYKLNYKHIVITGASSGLGRSLAVAYTVDFINNLAKNSANSNAKFLLSLTGRNLDRLKETATICTKIWQDLTANNSKYSSQTTIYNPDNSQHLQDEVTNETRLEIEIATIDVNQSQNLAEFLNYIDSKCPVDLIIANAGISGGTSANTESERQINQIFHTNINGVLNTIQPLIPKMIARKSGQIAIISSLAGFRGLASSPAYSASKAAIRVYGEALRDNLAKFSVKVNVVCPGYVKTPMTKANSFYMPFILTAEKASQVIIDNLKKNKARISFPYPLYFVVWLMAILPPSLTGIFLSKLPSKKALDL
jgi:short-subunit dehydrogenase